MARRTTLLAAPVLALAALATATNATDGSVATYVARDADGDRTISVGDSVGFIVDGDAVVTLRCWADETKTALVQHWVSPPYRPSVHFESTGRAVELAAAGYCETTGSAGGLHWFTVAPYRLPDPWMTFP